VIGDYTEEALSGHDIKVTGQIPYIPWAKITVPTGLRFLVDPNATVVSVLLAALCTQSRSARLNGISSLSIAKKYWRKNSPKLEKILRKCPTTG
jgi:hypothetical protein